MLLPAGPYHCQDGNDIDLCVRCDRLLDHRNAVGSHNEVHHVHLRPRRAVNAARRAAALRRRQMLARQANDIVARNDIIPLGRDCKSYKVTKS